MEEVHGISISIPLLWLTSAWRSYIISQLLTSLWSGGDNSMPREAVESTASGATSTMQATSRIRKKNSSGPDRMKKSMEEDSTPEWRIDPQKELSFPIDYKSWSSSVGGSSVARVITTTSSKYLPKCLSSRLQLNYQDGCWWVLQW